MPSTNTTSQRKSRKWAIGFVVFVWAVVLELGTLCSFELLGLSLVWSFDFCWTVCLMYSLLGLLTSIGLFGLLQKKGYRYIINARTIMNAFVNLHVSKLHSWSNSLSLGPWPGWIPWWCYAGVRRVLTQSGFHVVFFGEIQDEVLQWLAYWCDFWHIRIQ